MIYEELHPDFEYFFCPVCSSKVFEGISYCECEVGKSYFYEGNFYTVTSLLPWDTRFAHDDYKHVMYIKSTGGPNIALTSTVEIEEPEPKTLKVRIPKNWKNAKSNDDMRFSWSRTHGGLKGSLLKAKGNLKR